MGWFDDETGAERAARLRGENQQRQREHAQEQAEHRRKENFERRNWENKRAVYQRELQEARREGREPRYDTIDDVEDLIDHEDMARLRARIEAEEEARRRAEAGPPLIVKIVAGFIIVFVLLPALFSMVAPLIVGVLRVVFLVVLGLLAVLTLVWLILRFTAKEDPAKILRARRFNPVIVCRILFAVIVETIAERRARRSGNG